MKSKSSSQIMVRFIVSAVLLHISATITWSGFSEEDPTPKKRVTEPIPSEGVLLAKLKHPNSNQNQLSAVLRVNNVKEERSFRSIPGLRVLRMNDKANTRSREARMQGLKRRMDALMKTGLFDYVEPDWQVQVMQTPTDSALADGTLWGLLNTGQNGGVAGIDVNAVPAWSFTTGSPDIVVGVIDTGIRYTHQDITGNMWTNPGEIPSNGIDDDANGWTDDVYGINAILNTGDPMDDHDHGTHVAGTIAATAFDAGNHVGVAFNVRLMALKTLDAAGSGTVSAALASIDYAIAHGVDILNASWGGAGFSQALKDAIDAANSQGILFVAAAGNSGSNNDAVPFFPAGYDLPNIISVAAIDRTGDMASFSNYGNTTVDMGAPGVSIYSTTARSDSSYAYFNGTSMAAPHVSGVAALVASGHPSAEMMEIRARLMQSTAPLSSLNGFTATGGMVDAEAALLIAEDGNMEVQVTTPRGALVNNATNSVLIHVTDLLPVTGATVTGTIVGQEPVDFLDDGIDPDLQTNDAVYTADLTVSSGSTTVDFSYSITATGNNPIADTITFNLINPPPNDNFPERIQLVNTQSTTTGTNVEATLEPGEPIHPSFAGTHSVWWEWTPDISGAVTVSTVGSSFDTTLAVYQGTDLGSLGLIGEDDDTVGLQSAVGFTAVAGQSYLIQVNGYNNETGDISLNYGEFTVGVPNDDFANRIILDAGTTQTIGSNVGSSIETGEPTAYLIPGLDTVWWEWIAPSSDIATITTFGSDFDTVLAIYQGTELSNLVSVTHNDDTGGSQSSVTFVPTAGESYMIQVYGYLTDPVGTIVLNYPDPAPPAVSNDHFAQRILLEHGTTQTTGSNDGATTETDEPIQPVTAGDASVWWEWVAPLSGFVSINTNGSSFNTTLAVYSGDELTTLTLLAANDDATGIFSEVNFLATQGTSYMIQVNGSGVSAGNIKLNYPNPAHPRPLNDDFGQRILLDAGTIQTTGSNVGASIEADEPVHPTGSGSQSVWWEWIAASADSATITTTGSDFDTTIAIYSGNTLSGLSLVAENNDTADQQSSVTFDPVTGRRYVIQVNGNGSASGSITLNYPSPDIPRPINDNFENRIVLSAGTIQTEGSNENATSEAGEPVNPASSGGTSIWWEWIAPFSGTVTIDTFGSTIDTTLAIYTGTDLATLSLVGSNDDAIGYFSAVTFAAVAGQSYMIQLDSWPTLQGIVYLNYPMPFPIAATPGRFRLAGSAGTTLLNDLLLTNGDISDTDFSIASPDLWIDAIPSSGTLSAGSNTPVILQFGPLPSFSDVLSSTVVITLDHPSVGSIQLPVEIIHESLEIDIPDDNLRTVLEQNLGRLPGEPIADIEMAILTSLDATGKSIANLRGLEYAVNMFYLYLGNNLISDLQPLQSLSNLFILDLNNNNLSEISILQSLPILFDLDLRYNYLDISSGSDDRAIIDALSASATVLYDPQKTGMVSYSSWTGEVNIHPSNNKELDENGPLSLANILAFGMGLDPFTATASDMPIAYRDPDTNTYRFTYYRNLKALGVTTSILSSYDLGAWELATPVRINVLWDDGSGHQMVEAVFEDDSSKLFFTLDVSPY